MPKHTTSPRPHPQVVDTPLDDDETVLLHLVTKTYYTLNATGGHVWRGLKAGKSIDEIVDELQQVYEVSPEQAASSVLELIEDLEQRGLLTPAEGSAEHDHG